jgi:hypothetical protein
MSNNTLDKHWNDLLIEHAKAIHGHAKRAGAFYNVDPQELIAHGDHGIKKAFATYDPDYISPRTKKPVEFKTWLDSTMGHVMDEEAKKLKGGVSQRIQTEGKAVSTPTDVPPVTMIDPKGYIPQPPKK